MAADTGNLAIIAAKAKQLDDDLTIILAASEDAEWFDDQDEMRFSIIQNAAKRCQFVTTGMLAYAWRNKAQA